MAVLRGGLGCVLAHGFDGGLLHDHEVIVQGCPLVGGEWQAVEQGVNGFPPQPEGRAAHGGVHPAGAHAAEQVQGLFVVGPDVQGFGVVVVKLEAFRPRL